MFCSCPVSALDNLAFSLGPIFFIVLTILFFILLCLRQSHNLEARRKGLSFHGSIGLQWGAYRAGFVEQTRVGQRPTLRQGRAWKKKLKIKVIYVSSSSWWATLRGNKTCLLYSLIPLCIEQYLSLCVFVCWINERIKRWMTERFCLCLSRLAQSLRPCSENHQQIQL